MEIGGLLSAASADEEFSAKFIAACITVVILLVALCSSIGGATATNCRKVELLLPDGGAPSNEAQKGILSGTFSRRTNWQQTLSAKFVCNAQKCNFAVGDGIAFHNGQKGKKKMILPDSNSKFVARHGVTIFVCVYSADVFFRLFSGMK